MKPSSVFVLAAAVLFLLAGFAAFIEQGGPNPLSLAYFSLTAANIGFALL